MYCMITALFAGRASRGRCALRIPVRQTTDGRKMAVVNAGTLLRFTVMTRPDSRTTLSELLCSSDVIAARTRICCTERITDTVAETPAALSVSDCVESDSAGKRKPPKSNAATTSSNRLLRMRFISDQNRFIDNPIITRFRILAESPLSLACCRLRRAGVQ